MRKIICCPICQKIIGKMDEEGQMVKVYLWCRRCKKEVYIEDTNKIINKNKPES